MKVKSLNETPSGDSALAKRESREVRQGGTTNAHSLRTYWKYKYFVSIRSWERDAYEENQALLLKHEGWNYHIFFLSKFILNNWEPHKCEYYLSTYARIN